MDALSVLLARIGEGLTALGHDIDAAVLADATTPQERQTALRLAMASLKEVEAGSTTSMALVEAETWTQVEGRLCRADEAASWMLVCRRAVRALFLAAEGQGETSGLVARHALRRLSQIPLLTRPPYVPLEVPWMRRIPDSSEVASHAIVHPAPGQRVGAGNWLVSSRARDEAVVVELYVDEFGQVASWSHANEQGQRGALLSSLPFEGCSYLPLTAGLWPVFLLAPAAPVDPTGAPIRHVPTEKALTTVERLCDVAPDGAEDLALDAGAALTAVIRERDHHAGRVTELLGDATWQRLRGRAFAHLLGDLVCAGCAWKGTPHAAQLAARGHLLCPGCGLPALHAGDPTVVLAQLFETLGQAVAAAQAGPQSVHVAGTDQHGDHVEETVTIGARALWFQVSRIAEALANVTSAADPDGRGMRRVAVKAAQRAGDAASADMLAKRYLADAEKVEEPAGAVFFRELQAIAGFGGEMPEPPPFDPARQMWMCCGLTPCLCAVSWDLPPVSMGGDALAQRLDAAGAVDTHPLVCRYCEGPLTREEIGERLCAVRDGDFCEARPHPTHRFPAGDGCCGICDVNAKAVSALAPCPGDGAERSA